MLGLESIHHPYKALSFLFSLCKLVSDSLLNLCSLFYGNSLAFQQRAGISFFPPMRIHDFADIIAFVQDVAVEDSDFNSLISLLLSNNHLSAVKVHL